MCQSNEMLACPLVPRLAFHVCNTAPSDHPSIMLYSSKPERPGQTDGERGCQLATDTHLCTRFCRFRHPACRIDSSIDRCMNHFLWPSQKGLRVLAMHGIMPPRLNSSSDKITQSSRIRATRTMPKSVVRSRHRPKLFQGHRQRPKWRRVRFVVVEL